MKLRKNRYDESSKYLVISEDRARAIRLNNRHYRGLFMDDPQLADLREAYSIPANTIKEDARINKLNAFFFWASWSRVTERVRFF